MAGVAQRLGDEPDGRGVAVDVGERGARLGIDADDRLRIVLAGEFRQDSRNGIDDLAAARQRRVDERLCERQRLVFVGARQSPEESGVGKGWVGSVELWWGRTHITKKTTKE